MRPGKASELKRTWLGGGVMQMVQGAPGDIVPVLCVGRLPMAGRASAEIGAVGDVDVVVRVDANVVGSVELAGLIAGLAPGFEPDAVLVGLGDAGIDVAVADVGVAGGVPSHVGDLAKHAVDRR